MSSRQAADQSVSAMTKSFFEIKAGPPLSQSNIGLASVVSGYLLAVGGGSEERVARRRCRSKAVESLPCMYVRGHDTKNIGAPCLVLLESSFCQYHG